MRRQLQLAALVLALACAGCATAPQPQPLAPPATDAATVALIDSAIAGSWRQPANVARDRWRHPGPTLTFFGLQRTMTVMEVWPDPTGGYTEILAPVLRDHGQLIVATWDPAADGPYVRGMLARFRARLDARPDLYDKVRVAALQYPTALSPVPPGSVDMVLAFGRLHDWMARDTATPMLKAIFTALKPGGILGVVDHRGRADQPQDPQARSGYVREDYAIGLIESVGFRLLDTSEVNANPADTKDYDLGVWTLPPTLRLGDRDRERYQGIGESDRFTLRFRKPAGPG